MEPTRSPKRGGETTTVSTSVRQTGDRSGETADELRQRTPRRTVCEPSQRKQGTSSGYHPNFRLEIKADLFNRRMRKTACPVVWEGARAKSRAPDPIDKEASGLFFLHFMAFNFLIRLLQQVGIDIPVCGGRLSR